MFHKKSTANFITIIFTLLIIAQVFGFLIIAVINEDSNSASAGVKQGTNPLDNLQIEIPGLKEIPNRNITCVNNVCSVPWIGVYVSALYKYAIGSVGILATVVMMYAGMLWITAAGNTEQISKAKSYITASLTGLVLAFTSWAILFQVNPDLTSFRAINMVPVGEKPDSGCCVKDEEFLGILFESDCIDKQGEWGGKNSVWSSVRKNCRPANLKKAGLPCETESECMDGLICNESHRCANLIPTDGQACNEGNCSGDLYCFGDVYSHAGYCYDGSSNDPCSDNDDCVSGRCVEKDCWSTCIANGDTEDSCSNDCKEGFFLDTCNERFKRCSCF